MKIRRSGPIFYCFTVCALLFLGAGDHAGADAILFPWIFKDTRVSTIVSVVNTAAPSFNAGRTPVLHYQYLHKPVTASRTDACSENNFDRPTSQNDIVSFDASRHINLGKKLFNDPTDYRRGNIEDFSVLSSGSARAFLIVDNNTPGFVQAGTNVDSTLYGEALILDRANGVTWGYTAYNARYVETAQTAFDPVWFSDGFDAQGEVIGTGEAAPVALLPPGTATTRFFVTPLAHAADTAPIAANGQRTARANTAIQVCFAPGPDGCQAGGFFDGDENPISCSTTVEVVCTAQVDLSDLLGSCYEFFRTTAGQGWTYITTSLGTVAGASPQPDAAVGKLEFNRFGLVRFPFQSLGAFDRFLWIRNSDSRSSPAQ